MKDTCLTWIKNTISSRLFYCRNIRKQTGWWDMNVSGNKRQRRGGLDKCNSSLCLQRDGNWRDSCRVGFRFPRWRKRGSYSGLGPRCGSYQFRICLPYPSKPNTVYHLYTSNPYTILSFVISLIYYTNITHILNVSSKI